MDIDFDAPLDYLPRIKSYYVGLGYGKPYEWAKLDDVPFANLQKPLSAARIGIVTTASLFNLDNGDQGPGAPYNGKAKFFTSYAEPIAPCPDVRVAHIAIDRAHTTASDMASYFPLAALLRLAGAGYIGRYHQISMDCQPTGRSASPHKPIAQSYYPYVKLMRSMRLLWCQIALYAINQWLWRRRILKRLALQR